MENIIVSGIRPTGKLHIGNYLGAIKDFVKLQHEGKCFFFIADWHSLTTFKKYELLKEYSLDVAIDFLAAGLIPEKCTIFLQSDVPEIAELALLLSMFQPANELYTLPTYKEKAEKDSNAGLLYYPILMAADILAHKAHLVPVGSDQEIHIRISREIARRFNNTFGDFFPTPQTFEKESIKVPGLDGSEKMGKSEGNTINLSDSPKAIEKKISVAVTDTARKRRQDPGNPFECNIFAMHELVSKEETVKLVRTGCNTTDIGCVDCKNILSQRLIEMLKPLQERRKTISTDYVERVLREGAEKARESANNTLKQVREKMGFINS